jgi:glycosyltransferase involved in cell wall biosynthesis
MSTHAPRVSIGLPVYNGERYLSEAIDGILAQTFDDFELVISDNGSTDGTEAIGRRYAAQDRRVRYHRHAQNRGGSWNYNTVFALTTAEYYMWHACDDRIGPTYVERGVAVLERMPEVVVCHANTVIIDGQGQEIARYVEGLDLLSPSPSRRYRQYHDHDRDCPLCSVYFGLMRRSVLIHTPLMAPHVNSESNLMSDLALRGQFYEIPEHLFFRRDHEGISTRKYVNHADRVAWYDPSRIGKGGHPGWQQMRHQLRSVARAPMSPVEKARCYAVAGRYFWWLARGSLRNAGGDVRRRIQQARGGA